jgi:hypothetical protein
MGRGSFVFFRMVALLFCSVLLPWQGVAQGEGVRTLDRDDDPVIITGDGMPSFAQLALNSLFVYAYTGGEWQQIPWQFDEVVNGHLTDSEDGLLDGDDQLVFMGGDTGDQAPAASWIDNADSLNYPRYEIAVTDPISPSKKGWVYVYRSATDTVSVTTDYVDFDIAQWLFTTGSYIVGITPNRFSVNRLEMNGSGTDIIDRTKIRAFTPSLYRTEDDLQLLNPVVHDGRVRAYVTNYDDPLGIISYSSMIGYRSSIQLDFAWDFSLWFTAIDWIRLSADLSPAAVGSVYYDANTTGGLTVDGNPDSIATTPFTNWWQVSGSSGSVVQMADLTQLGGTRTNYYKDDATVDPSDTGDQKSYSDCGAYLTNANSNLVFKLWYNILPASQPPVGGTYLARAVQPLQAEATSQTLTARRLTVTISGEGSGSVASDPVGIDCPAGACSAFFNLGSTVILTSSAGPHSRFGDWEGECGITLTGGCSVVMDADRAVVASFDINPAEAVRIDPGTIYYDKIGAAYQSPGVSHHIKACRVEITENLDLNLGKTIILSGGYDSDYGDNSGLTTVKGMVTVSSGIATMDNIAIR